MSDYTFKKQWYFISYDYAYTSKTSHYAETSIMETLTNEHPLVWLSKMRKEYSESKEARYRYYIRFWAEISDEVAEKYKEEFE